MSAAERALLREAFFAGFRAGDESTGSCCGCSGREPEEADFEAWLKERDS